MNSKHILLLGTALSSIIFYTGCSSPKESAAAPAPVTKPAPAVTQAAATAPAPMAMGAAIRIVAGVSTSVTNSDGTIWLGAKGFADGETIERPDVEIVGTKEAAIYHSERYSMTAFSLPVPNGKYTVKLHFCETYEGITDKGQRVFSFNVEGKEFKDLDVFAKAGGALKPYIETVPVEVTDGKLDISFTPNVENPEINGVEIIPAH